MILWILQTGEKSNAVIDVHISKTGRRENVIGRRGELFNRVRKLTKFKNGERKFGGRMVFGYENNNGEIVVNTEQSKVVKFIFKKMNGLMKQNLTKTKRTQKLLKSLRRKGYLFKGKDFSNQNIKSILNNKFYIGEMIYGDIKTNHVYDTIVSKRLFNKVHFG